MTIGNGSFALQRLR